MDKKTATRWLWNHSTVKRVRNCRRQPTKHSGNTTVTVRSTGQGHVNLSGVGVCGSAWLCPTCSRNIFARRFDEVHAAIASMEDPYMVTLTRSHGQRDALADLLRDYQQCWRKTVNAAFQKRKVKYLRMLEINDGKHGWHPHLHVVVDGQSAAQRLREKWLVNQPHANGQAQDITKVTDSFDAAKYLTLEVLNAQVKGASHWALLGRAVDGDSRAQARWFELEKATKNVRMISTSRGLVHLADDEEIAVGDAVGQVLDEVPVCSWKRLQEYMPAFEQALDGWADWDTAAVTSAFELVGVAWDYSPHVDGCVCYIAPSGQPRPPNEG